MCLSFKCVCLSRPTVALFSSCGMCSGAMDKCRETIHYETIVTTKKVTAFIIIAGIITGLFSLSPLFYPIEPQKHMNTANDTIVEQTGFENLTSGYLAFYWVCVLAFVVMNITTTAIYSVILGILKKQLQKIHPHDQALYKSRSHYKGVTNCFSLWFIFAVCWDWQDISCFS